MKTLLTFVFVVFFAVFTMAQINPTTDKTKYNDSQNMDVVYQKEATYPAGEAAMYKLIYESISYSDEAKNASLNTKLMISFDVGFDSLTSNFVILQSVGFGIDEAVVKVLSKEKFSPAIMNGIPVRQNMILTIPVVTYPEMK